ncbi:hypothetical protein [Pandoraea sputorum]|uniref:hypothetical protein n=1 Tax=Pandoraea sputorum TaxID=93222 RepID=UPI001240FA50|nr:hypothetical protein [Pandoraea sputorum]VVE59306.1 hypothetical protein PSP20601_05499 [Pandoraea sputorum]
MVFPNADGVKQFALHGKVQRCRLETPDAALKTMLTLRETTLVDILLYGVARILGWAGIYIDPPGPLDNALWERTRPQDPRDVVQQPPPNLLKVATHRVQASHSGTQERDAALAFGAYCQSMASRLLPYSYSKKFVEANQAEGERRDELLAQAESYGTIIDGIRNKLEFARYKSIACVSLLTNALKFSTGDCTEMALVTAALAQSNAKQFLSERGLANVEIKAEIYETKSHGDHAVCVMTLEFPGFTYKIAIDPWVEVSMLYEHYVDYVTTYPINLYIEKDTTFGVSESVSRTINQEYFMKQASNILKKYLAEPGA